MARLLVGCWVQALAKLSPGLFDDADCDGCGDGDVVGWDLVVLE